MSPECLILAYHTRHFPAGCMAVPFLQWNTSEKASKFCKEPITLNKEKGLIYMEIAVLRNREPCPESGLEPQNLITVQNMGYFRK